MTAGPGQPAAGTPPADQESARPEPATVPAALPAEPATVTPAAVSAIPLFWLLGGLVVGLVLTFAVGWRIGIVVLGLVLVAGGGARLVLPSARIGQLAVRSRGLDAAFLAVIGIAMVVVAASLP